MGSQEGKTYRLYRCNGTLAAYLPREERCHARSIPASEIERAIWADCKQWIENPSETIAEVHASMRDRLAQSTGLDNQRRTLIQQIAEKTTERERVMTLYRRGRVPIEDAERQLDAIAHEEGQLQGMLSAIRAQEDLAQAAEAQLTETAQLLARFRSELADIERDDDWQRRAEIMHWLVRDIVVTTVGEGKPRRIEPPHVTYLFSPPESRLAVVDISTGYQTS